MQTAGVERVFGPLPARNCAMARDAAPMPVPARSCRLVGPIGSHRYCSAIARTERRAHDSRGVPADQVVIREAYPSCSCRGKAAFEPSATGTTNPIKELVEK